MRRYLMALGCDVWISMIKGYDVLETTPSNTTTKKCCNDNSRVVNAIRGGLTNNVFVKVMHCK
jgi:hypothetical protein